MRILATVAELKDTYPGTTPVERSMMASFPGAKRVSIDLNCTDTFATHRGVVDVFYEYRVDRYEIVKGEISTPLWSSRLDWEEELKEKGFCFKKGD